MNHATTTADRTIPAAAPVAIKRLFVANRGEIAARIRRTCDRLGIQTIVPATDGPDAIDLLDIDAVVAAARAARADAVHVRGGKYWDSWRVPAWPDCGYPDTSGATIADSADSADSAACSDCDTGECGSYRP